MAIPDTTEIPILGTVSAPVEIPTGPGGSAKLSVHGYRAVDFMCYVLALGSVTALDVSFEVSSKADPGDDDWALIQSQAISSGLATLSDYVARKAIAAPGSYLVSMEARCLWIRPVFGVQGTATGSSFYVTALRRT